MKRTLTAVVLVLLLAACGSQTGSGSFGGTTGSSTAGGDTTGSGTTGSSAAGSGTAGSGTTGGDTTGGGIAGSGTTGSGTTGGGSGGYATVSGRIVRGDTRAPYPNAYVRFGWLVNATYEKETHTVTDGSGKYTIQLPPGQYQVTAGDACDLNAGFTIVGRNPDDTMITVPGTSVVDFVEFPITPGADIPGAC